MIGLYDDDVMQDDEWYIPNLGMAKLFDYYKIYEKQYTKLITDLDEIDDYNFSEIIVRKDRMDTPYPVIRHKRAKISYGGRAYNDGEYDWLCPQAEKFKTNYKHYRVYLLDYKERYRREKKYKLILNAYGTMLTKDDINLRSDLSLFPGNRAEINLAYDRNLADVIDFTTFMENLPEKAKIQPVNPLCFSSVSHYVNFSKSLRNIHRPVNFIEAKKIKPSDVSTITRNGFGKTKLIIDGNSYYSFDEQMKLLMFVYSYHLYSRVYGSGFTLRYINLDLTKPGHMMIIKFIRDTFSRRTLDTLYPYLSEAYDNDMLDVLKRMGESNPKFYSLINEKIPYSVKGIIGGHYD